MEKQVRVGIAAIIKKDNKILLLRRAVSFSPGTWAPPGGHLDFGEDIYACVEREVFEETGLKIKNFKFAGITNDYFKDLGKHYITIWFECEFPGGEVILNPENSEFAWFSLENLPSPLFLPFKNYVENLIR